MGIRILLLFKSDWLQVHDYLMERYEDILMDAPFAYIRRGTTTACTGKRLR